MCLKDWNKALWRSVQENDLELLEICLQNGADINSQDEIGYTALMKAVIYSRERATEILLENRADINIKNNKGETAYDFIKDSKNSRIKKLLKTPIKERNYKLQTRRVRQKHKNFRNYIKKHK